MARMNPVRAVPDEMIGMKWLSEKSTYVAVRLIIFSSHGDDAVFQQGHDSLEVALVDDATVVRAGLGVVCVELLSVQTIS